MRRGIAAADAVHAAAVIAASILAGRLSVQFRRIAAAQTAVAVDVCFHGESEKGSRRRKRFYTVSALNFENDYGFKH